jgi:hypothetical protein
MSTATPTTLPDPWERAGRTALLYGGAGAVLGALALAVGPVSRQVFLQAYLVAYLFWIGIALGCLGIVMLHHLVGGAWGFLIRRPLEAAAMTLPLMTLLFLPFLFGLSLIYPWAQPDRLAADATLRHKAPYLNVTGFLVRAAVYFALWNGLALLLYRGSQAQDQTEDPAPTRRSQAISGIGLALVFLTVTFAMIDWVMSLEPDWYSTIYGAMLLVGMGVSGFSAMIIVAASLADFEPLDTLAGPEAFHDLGNLLLAFVMLWAYMSFSQFLIVWSGNLTEEIPWYLRRSAGGWRWVCAALMVFHFFLPFFVLLFRESKRNPRNLWKVAVLILVIHLVNDVWLVIPAFPHPKPWGAWLAVDFAVAFLGVGGLWLGTFAWLLGGRPLVPMHDPVLAHALAHHKEGH